MEAEYGLMTVTELRQELKRRNARTTGKKEDLILRLYAYDRNNNFVLRDDCNPSSSWQEDGTNPEALGWPSENLFKTVKQGSDAPHNDIGHLNKYFFDMTNGTGREGITMCASIQRKGHVMMKEKFMSALAEYQSVQYFYRAQINSEMTKKLTYFVRIVIDIDGSVVESNCECIAGKGPRAVCKHVATVLFAILYFREHGIWYIRNTCTDEKQLWHMPKKSTLEISPKKAENINFYVPEYSIQKKQQGNMCYDPRPQCYKNMPNFNAHVRNMVINYNSTRKRKLAISGCYTPASLEGICNDHDYLNISPQQHMIYNRIKVTEEKAQSIEKKTRGQSSCNSWHEERSLRVTASKVGTIMNMTERRNKISLAEEIVNPKLFRSAPTEYGKTNEKNAIAAYERSTTKKVTACGLHISPEHSYLAGSPDGLVAQNTVLEVKCPYSIRDQCINADNVPYLESKDGVLCLKKNSNYYYQVQTQMFVAQRDHCDFVLWTKNDYKSITIEKDSSLINNTILPKVKDFYDTYMVPTLYKKLYT